eukprot:7817543-Pyramimonas_sp.AAC.1
MAALGGPQGGPHRAVHRRKRGARMLQEEGHDRADQRRADDAAIHPPVPSPLLTCPCKSSLQ